MMKPSLTTQAEWVAQDDQLIGDRTETGAQGICLQSWGSFHAAKHIQVSSPTANPSDLLHIRAIRFSSYPNFRHFPSPVQTE